jgi:hypothetical protein
MKCPKCGSWTVHNASGHEDEIRAAVEAGNSQYWHDAKGSEPSQGSIIDYITRAVMSALTHLK